MKFTKKPVQVDAEQLTCEYGQVGKNPSDLRDWALSHGETRYHFDDRAEYLNVYPPESHCGFRVHIGDWLIRYADGSFEQQSNERFLESHEPVTSGELEEA